MIHMIQKIYDAIQRGLNEALANFSGDHVNEQMNQTWIEENFIDLGLPSGTLWAKYNVGATPDIYPESWYGGYYRWGSTKDNKYDNCSWRTALYNGGSSTYSKENFIQFKDRVVDQNGNLLPKYDVAYQTDHLMHMPTRQDMQELEKYTMHEWVEGYNGINGLSGVVLTGRNGNSIFIPATGYRYGNLINDRDCGYLWSRSLMPHDKDYVMASHLWYDDDTVFPDSSFMRCYGLPVRGIINRTNTL